MGISFVAGLFVFTFFSFTIFFEAVEEPCPLANLRLIHRKIAYGITLLSLWVMLFVYVAMNA